MGKEKCVCPLRRNIASFSSIPAAAAAEDPPPGRGEEEEKEGKGRNFTFDMGKLLISFPRGMEREKKVGEKSEPFKVASSSSVERGEKRSPLAPRCCYTADNSSFPSSSFDFPIDKLAKQKRGERVGGALRVVAVVVRTRGGK